MFDQYPEVERELIRWCRKVSKFEGAKDAVADLLDIIESKLKAEVTRQYDLGTKASWRFVLYPIPEEDGEGGMDHD